MAKKVLGGAAGALALATDAVKHVAWYVAHQVQGRPRDGGRDPRDTNDR